MKEEISFILVCTLIGLAVSIGIVTLVLVCRIDDRVGELMKPLTNAKKPKNLRFIQLDEIGGNCPLCDRTVRFAQKHCHNCTQLLDWTEAVTWSADVTENLKQIIEYAPDKNGWREGAYLKEDKELN